MNLAPTWLGRTVAQVGLHVLFKGLITLLSPKGWFLGCGVSEIEGRGATSAMGMVSIAMLLWQN
jgi:hypothetical protein